MTLEMTRLSQLTGNQTYFNFVSSSLSLPSLLRRSRTPLPSFLHSSLHISSESFHAISPRQVQRVTDILDTQLSPRSAYPPLMPTSFDPDEIDGFDGVFTFGGSGASTLSRSFSALSALSSRLASSLSFSTRRTDYLHPSFRVILSLSRLLLRIPHQTTSTAPRKTASVC